jgi:TPR repeat protein
MSPADSGRDLTAASDARLRILECIMLKQLGSALRSGLYWTLALAVSATVAHDAGALAKRKPKTAETKPPAVATEDDPSTEWKLIDSSASEVREKMRRSANVEVFRQQLADLAIRSAAGAERALAIGDAALFDAYRTQFREQFPTQRWRLTQMAERGNGRAAFALGVVALHGIFGPPGVEAACRHFETALAKGYGGAKFRVSQCVAKNDVARAAVLMREAADAGHPAAAEVVGRDCLEAKPLQAACAWDRLTLAAAAGRPSAQSVLAWMYAQGTGGRAADPARAVRLYQQAARAGNAAAQNNVGELYETGRGLAADLKLALDWYRKAAEAGFAPAQFNLGRLYAAGTGIAKDYAEARKWLEQAERGGVTAARTLLDWMDKNPDSK